MKKLIKKILKSKIFISLIVLGLIGIIALVSLNAYVMLSVKDRIVSEEEAASLKADCILVLGAGVWNNGKPSAMLEDRLLQGIKLYDNGTSDKLLMSGDHGRIEYDEVNVMKQFAIDRNVPSENVFMDHAGFSTYESMYRAKEIFQAKKIIIVTQKYHLYRSLYIAEKLGLDAYGVASNPRKYAGQQIRDARELLARSKDFIYVLTKAQPTYLGDTIAISGNGDLTNDKKKFNKK